MKNVRFGIGITATDPPDEFIETVKLAEVLGFDSVWVPDFRLYQDLYVSLALAAINTERIRIGSAVTNPYTRHPGMTAVGIASVDRLSGGRAVLGIATGGLVLRLLGIEREAPVRATREAILEIRQFFGNEEFASGNGHIRLDLPVRPDLPIFVGATGPQMLGMAGELADGAIINVGADPSCMEVALAALEQGIARGARPPGSVEKLCWLQGTAVSAEDPAGAMNLVKPAVALTLGRSPSWMLEAMGIEEAPVREIHNVYYSQGAHEAATLVTDEMVDKFTIAGTPQRAVQKLENLSELGYDEFIFLTEEFGGNIHTAMQTLAETVVAEFRGA